ncbi:LOW QUALITY PROTEIN: branched-chain-amino-acid aminotransferase, cytosolic-like [Argopecten irradians]|uniref:LOW QUALITY PROTEIN: branched-chain-amino-acid aminotransferase, cytosolic-like n=1 Tax=Argopecten irradians TaxID=31199 RepID=UPI00371F3F98
MAICVRKPCLGIRNILQVFRPGLASQTSSFKSGPSFKYEDLQITLTTNPHPKPDVDKLVFGRHHSDHMLSVEWDNDKGWGKPHIHPVQNLSIHPAAKVFHYAVELFEGMKSYRGHDNKIRLFRPMENMERMVMSAERACLPLFDGRELVQCMKKLISIDEAWEAWVPHSTEVANALYLRPTFIGTEPCLGVARSKNALLYVLTGPVGPYYPTGLKPVNLLADPNYARAWPGGCGMFKMGSNYAPTIAVQDLAEERGCQQVLWLYGDKHEMTEVGTMNLFLHWINKQGEEELITAPLNGIVLPGITRSSLLHLAKEWNEFKVSEEVYTMEEMIEALQENRVIELFGAGTAAVVSPVARILYNDEWVDLPVGDENSLTQRFYNTLTDIQYGKTPSPPNWMEDLDDIKNSSEDRVNMSG